MHDGRTAPEQASLAVLTWNLFHGRSVPDARHDLFDRFAALLAAWDWDVSLLQEVPPWWPAPLAVATESEQRRALTSRNLALPLRRALAERRPDLMKSNGGGCNTVLARGAIVEHARLRLRTWPERRVAQMVRLASGHVVVNHHGSTRVPLAEDELSRLWEAALAFAGDAPLVLGGDLNLRAPKSPPGAVHVAARDVDHVFAVGMRASGAAALFDRDVALAGGVIALSDHPPLSVRLVRA